MNEELYADVVVDLNIRRVDRLFTYRVPPPLDGEISPGSIVQIPFRNRNLAGFVVNLTQTPPEQQEGVKIRDLISILQRESPWSRELIDLAFWMHQYYGCTLLEALKTSLPPLIRIEPESVRLSEKREKIVSLREPAEATRSALGALQAKAPRQAEVLTWLIDNDGTAPLQTIREALGCSCTVFDELSRKQLVTIESRTIRRDPAAHRNLIPSTPLKLNAGQQKCLDMITTLMDREKGGVMLVHGITGSGKTEVYLQALESCLARGRSGMVLIPEISLTPQMLDRFRGRFGVTVSLLHSRLTPGERLDEWRRIQKGESRIVVGARSAVFAPLENPYLFILDEEHETSYKQEGMAPRYHARHIAIKRALFNGGVALLGSATPSLESFYLAREGKYSYCFMPERVLGRKPPEVKIVDLTKRYNRTRDGLLSPIMIKKIKQTLKKGEQIILLLNRRGFFNYAYCEECGHIIKCPCCDISLRLHKVPQQIMKCHYCLFESSIPDVCPKCGGCALKTRGSGTQRLEIELGKLCPDARILRMDRDTTGVRGSFETIYDAFAGGEADILLGTQMIAKGFDFPGVTLVGVILADVALSLPDFRAAERTYQLLMQVAGRTSRGDIPGEVVVQTYSPAHPVIASTLRQDSRDFYLWELNNRKELEYPPLRHIIRVTFTGEAEAVVAECSREFRRSLHRAGMADMDLLGPAPCPVTQVRSNYRYHLIIKSSKVPEGVEILKAIKESFARLPVSIIIDVDPVSFL